MDRISINNQFRILIVDDNRAIHDDFRKILLPASSDNELDELEKGLFGETESTPETEMPVYEIDSAFQGEAGIELVAKSVAENQTYSMAFVDMRMPPGIDGVSNHRKTLAIRSGITSRHMHGLFRLLMEGNHPTTGLDRPLVDLEKAL